jgi:hypothetical protein
VSAAFETARDFAEHGLRVFPCHTVIDGRCTCGRADCASPGKHPLTRNGSTDATADERTLLRWNERHPEANWAVVCGPNGLAVIDPDPHKGGDPREVIAEHGLEDCPTVWTGDHEGVRGAHVYALGESNGNHLADEGGIDIIGGYVLLPGSRHASGTEYAWANGLRPWNTPLKPVPEALRPRPSRSAPTAPAEPAERVPKGKRHLHLKKIAEQLVRVGLTDEATLRRHLLVEYEERCVQQPPREPGKLEELARWWAGSNIAKRERALAEGDEGHSEGDGGPRSPESLLIDMQDAMARAGDPAPYRLRPVALDGYLTLLVGRRGDDKTWLVLFACNAVGNGGEIAPLHATQGPALLFDGESGPRLLANRFTTMGLAHDAFHVADGSEIRLPDDIDTVRAVVEHVGAKLVVFDSLRRMAPGMREDKSDDATPVMAALAKLTRDTGAAGVVVHNRSTKPGAPDVRGSSALEDQADAVFVLERDPNDPERRTRRRLRCTKMRPDREPSSLWLSFKPVAGFMTLSEAEPYTGGERDDEDSTTAHEVLADVMRALGPKVRADGGWSPKQLAEALGTEPKNGTFQRAKTLLIESGEWEQTGTTKDRRLRPVDSSQSRQPLRDGSNGSNQGTQEKLLPDPPEDPPGNAIYGPEGDG